MAGKIDLTIGEIQAHLQILLENGTSLSPEQRYSLNAAIESFDFIKKIAKPLHKSVLDRSDK